MAELLSTPSTQDALVTDLAQRYRETRTLTEQLCAPLLIEDYVIQSMPEVSPPKWHLAHTTWFFENFLLGRQSEDFVPFHPAFHFLFNSYYKSEGAHFERSRRGLLSRPSVDEIYRYRHATDLKVLAMLASTTEEQLQILAPILTLGLQHEQQHQELLLTDIKHILWSNPLRPAYRPNLTTVEKAHPDTLPPMPARVLGFPEGITQIGELATAATFAFDHEKPRHRVFLEAYGIHSLPVTCGEYLEFMEAGGYSEPMHWLSEGWEQVQKHGWRAPLYWEKHEGRWLLMTLAGMRAVDEQEPVCHVSYFEADAFARWRGLRLPTEAEWENAAGTEIPSTARLIPLNENDTFHPRRTPPGFFGNVWEWTSSAYLPYPGFKPLPASLGEYNGKFMCNQFVLRGGSCATSRDHIRSTYRNFFPPDARWQFSGLRLAT